MKARAKSPARKRILLSNTTGSRLPVSEKTLEDALLLWQKRIAIPDISLALIVTTDAEIRRLNRTYRGKNSATDVLSFPQNDFKGPEKIAGTRAAASSFLGDIIISTDTCRVQAAQIGHSVRDEFLRLFVHGFLHLCGYDHEISKKDETRMFRREDELLGLLDGGMRRRGGSAA